MKNDQIRYQVGISEAYREKAVELYDEAFGKKIATVIKDKRKRIMLLEDSFLLRFVIGAFYEKELVGIAGFHTLEGSLTGGISYRDLITHLGFVQGNSAALLFSMYERKPKTNELVMDGIAVQDEYRGKGIGARLLEEVGKLALREGFEHIRLDVIDSNPKAKKLYERKGFKTIKRDYFSYLHWLLGFSASETMILRVT